jgi:hypothetical protein
VRIAKNNDGTAFYEAGPLLDDAVVLERRIDTRELDSDVVSMGKELFRALTFASGWRDAYAASEDFIDSQVEFALNYLGWTYASLV